MSPQGFLTQFSPWPNRRLCVACTSLAGVAAVGLIVWVSSWLTHHGVDDVAELSLPLRAVAWLGMAYLLATAVVAVEIAGRVVKLDGAARPWAWVIAAQIFVLSTLAVVMWHGPTSRLFLVSPSVLAAVLATVSLLAAALAMWGWWLSLRDWDLTARLDGTVQARSLRPHLVGFAYLASALLLAASVVWLETRPLPTVTPREWTKEAARSSRYVAASTDAEIAKS